MSTVQCSDGSVSRAHSVCGRCIREGLPATSLCLPVPIIIVLTANIYAIVITVTLSSSKHVVYLYDTLYLTPLALRGRLIDCNPRPPTTSTSTRLAVHVKATICRIRCS